MGPSLQGVNNIANLTYQSGSILSGTSVSPTSGSNVFGNVINLNISSEANYSFTWNTSINSLSYDTNNNQWYLVVTSNQIPAELEQLSFMNLILTNGLYISNPIEITQHTFNNGQIRLYFNTSAITNLPFNNQSNILILDEPSVRKLSYFISRVQKLKPDWCSISYS